jgi:hypothetical protein
VVTDISGRITLLQNVSNYQLTQCYTQKTKNEVIVTTLKMEVAGFSKMLVDTSEAGLHSLVSFCISVAEVSVFLGRDAASHPGRTETALPCSSSATNSFIFEI